jgi:spermidine/putrescine transport system permease protein
VDVAISRRGRRLVWTYFGLLLVFLYAPIAILVVFSFNDSSIPVFPLSGFTFKWYEQALSNDALLDSLRTSAFVALVSALLSVAIGILAALALVRRRFRGKAAASALMLSPLVIPYIVLGIALLVFFRLVEVEMSNATVILGHTVLTLPFVILILLPRLERIPRELTEAARDLGASAVKTFWFVTFPLLAPATISAFLIAATISFDEYAVASFLVGDHATFPVYLFGQLRFPRQLPQVIAVAVLVMVVSLLVVLLAEVGRRIGERALERRTDEGEART